MFWRERVGRCMGGSGGRNGNRLLEDISLEARRKFKYSIKK